MNNIIKRDGRVVPFDKNKIIDAVLAAFKDVDGELSDYAYIKAGNIADFVAEEAEIRELTIEEIQDIVEKGLMSTKRKDVAKSYIMYRKERSDIRMRNSEITKIIKEKVLAKNVQNQNANVDEHSFGGRMGEANSAVMRNLALNEFVSPMAKQNHINNEIYIHDLDHYVVGDHNCLSIPFDDLLEKGFNTRQVDIRPANSINTAFQLIAVIFQLQSLQQFGGVSATHLDWTMVPYVRKSFTKHFIDGLKYIEGADESYLSCLCKESMYNTPIDNEEIWTDYGCDKPAYNYAMDMTKREIHQAVEAMYHNLNSLQSRSGNQLKWMAG